MWELSNPKGNLTKSEKLIEEAIQIFDDLMAKINSISGENLKDKFKALNEERKKLMETLLKKSAAL